MKTTHEQKVALARKMPRTAQDDEDNESKFTTAAWERRKGAIAVRVAKKQAATHQRALDRKEIASGKPLIMTRARIALQKMKKRATERKRARQARYQAKHATV